MGAKVVGDGTERIEIQGVTRLTGGAHRIIPDRIETATYAAAAAIRKQNPAISGNSSVGIVIPGLGACSF